MYYNDNFDPNEDNENVTLVSDNSINKFEKELETFKRKDKGYSQIKRRYLNSLGKIKYNKIDLYTSGSVGTYIRDAETGSYYTNKVGTTDEDLFFKVSFSTGELKTKNGSNVLFYLSPQHYMKHLNVRLSQETINLWELKRDNSLKQSKKCIELKPESYVVVH